MYVYVHIYLSKGTNNQHTKTLQNSFLKTIMLTSIATATMKRVTKYAIYKILQQ